MQSYYWGPTPIKGVSSSNILRTRSALDIHLSDKLSPDRVTSNTRLIHHALLVQLFDFFVAAPAIGVVSESSMLEKFETRIATWNLQGKLQDPFHQELLDKDMETRCESMNTKLENGTIICLKPNPLTPAHQQYGQGFYISNKLIPHFRSIKYISDRISVIQFHLNRSDRRPTKLTIINVYAPTSQRVNTNEESKSHYDFIAGDLNEKIGVKLDPAETFIGNYGKGTRNRNGHLLANFLQDQNLYITNTTFSQPFRHRTTRSMFINGQNRYNQIEYVIMQNARLRRGHRHIQVNSRSYNGTIYESDYRLLVTTFSLQTIYHQRPDFDAPTPKYDPISLSTSTKLQDLYSRTLANKLDNLHTSTQLNPTEYFSQLTDIITEAATSHIPIKQPPLRFRPNSYIQDQFIKQWAEQRKKIIRRLRNHRCFEAQRLLKRTFYTPFKLQDEDNHTSYHRNTLDKHVTNWYKEFFNQTDIHSTLEPWIGEPAEFTIPIKKKYQLQHHQSTTEEQQAKTTLKVNIIDMKAKKLHEHISIMFNQMFQNHQHLNAIGEGILIPLNKTNGKPPVVSNTRPITLLNSIRKLLANIVLKRIQPIILRILLQ
eukprot:gene6543-13238_t